MNIRRQPANSLRDRFQFLSGSSRLQRQLFSQQYRLRRQSSQFLAEDIMKFTGNSFTFFVPNRHQSARQHAQLFVALQQGRLRVLSRRHICDERNGEYLLIRLDMAQTDFDGKLPAVLLPPKQIDAGSHWTSLGLFEKMVTIFDVMLAQAFRDQGFDSALQQLFFLIAKHVFGHAIRKNNPVPAIDC